jgi:hypothetical protein
MLSPGILSWQDGGSPSTGQLAEDVTIFLEWVAEPDWRSRRLQAIRAILYWVCALVAVAMVAAAPIVVRHRQIIRGR